MKRNDPCLKCNTWKYVKYTTPDESVPKFILDLGWYLPFKLTIIFIWMYHYENYEKEVKESK